MQPPARGGVIKNKNIIKFNRQPKDFSLIAFQK